ncbi:unnamed protein product [Sphagnum jensenii]
MMKSNHWRTFAKTYIEAQPARHQAQIKALADQLKFEKTVRVIVIVPTLVTEVRFANAIEALKRAVGRRRDVAVVFFVNGNSSTSRKEFENLSEKIKTRISAASEEKFFSRNFRFLFHHFSGRPGIGLIRSVATDSVIFASLRDRIDEPVLLSHDCDVQRLSADFFSHLLAGFKAYPLMVAGEGVVRFGSLKQRQENPYLAIYDVLLDFFDERPLHRYVGPYPAIHGWGACSFFMSGAYCRAGGYNRSLPVSEDLNLLRRIEAFDGKGVRPFLGFMGERVIRLSKVGILTDARSLPKAIESAGDVLKILDRDLRKTVKKVRGKRFKPGRPSFDSRLSLCLELLRRSIPLDEVTKAEPWIRNRMKRKLF